MQYSKDFNAKEYCAWVASVWKANLERNEK